MAELPLPDEITPSVIPPFPTLQQMETTFKTKLNPQLWAFIVEHKTHAQTLSRDTPDYTQFGPQGMRTNLRHTLTAQRLFPKLSLISQAERADGVFKSNATNLQFNVQQLWLIMRDHNVSMKDMNITAVAGTAYGMLYSTLEVSQLWCFLYQVIMSRHIGAILKAKHMPTIDPKVKLVKTKGTTTCKAKR